MAQLTTASPWAIKTRVKMSGSYMSGALNGAERRRPPDTSVHATGPPVHEIEASGLPEAPVVPRNSTAPVAFYGEVVVSWESAAPVRFARREPLGPEFQTHYALRVTGLPAQTFMPDGGRTPLIFRLLNGTTIEGGSHKRIPSDYVLRMAGQKSLLFAFPMATFPLSQADHYVSFAMDLNEMEVRARFDLRQMKFRNLLAV